MNGPCSLIEHALSSYDTLDPKKHWGEVGKMWTRSHVCLLRTWREHRGVNPIWVPAAWLWVTWCNLLESPFFSPVQVGESELSRPLDIIEKYVFCYKVRLMGDTILRGTVKGETTASGHKHIPARMHIHTDRGCSKRPISQYEVILINTQSSIWVPKQKNGVEWQGLAVVQVKINKNLEKC